MLCLLSLFSIVTIAGGANILGLMPITSPSHHIWNKALLHELAYRGHNLTVLSVDVPEANEKLPKNIHYIHLEKSYQTWKDGLDLSGITGTMGLSAIPYFYEWGFSATKGTVESEGWRTLLNYPDDFRFDLVIYDYTFGHLLLGFVDKFNYPPLVGMTAFLINPLTIDLIGNPLFPSYVPHWSTSYDVDMNIVQRFHNTAIYIYDVIYRKYIYNPKIESIARPHLPKDCPPLTEIEKRTVLALVNSNPVVTYAEPLPPNVIEVGGLQINDPKPLPNKLENFIKSSKKGTILFAMGTNVPIASFGAEGVADIIKAMEELPEYNFLWKFDLEGGSYSFPKNVLVEKFLPQSDILAHNNTVAFISHCGGLSTFEATKFGVPIIGVPFFVDQFRNLRKAITDGAAVELSLKEFNAKNLKAKVLEVVGNPSYRQNMRKRAKKFNDQPMKPLDRAVWWIEYVLRNPEPVHFISPAINMNMFTAYSMDLFGILLISIFVVSILILRIFVRSKCNICKKFKTN